MSFFSPVYVFCHRGPGDFYHRDSSKLSNQHQIACLNYAGNFKFSWLQLLLTPISHNFAEYNVGGVEFSHSSCPHIVMCTSEEIGDESAKSLRHGWVKHEATFADASQEK